MAKKTSPPKQVLPTDQVLSVRQPYAQLLVTPSKRLWIENRSWEPSMPVGSWLLIHASSPKMHPAWYEDFGLRLENCVHGAIIGYAKLVGWKRLILNTDSDKASKENDIVWKQHCSELRNIVEKSFGVRPQHGMIHAASVLSY